MENSINQAASGTENLTSASVSDFADCKICRENAFYFSLGGGAGIHPLNPIKPGLFEICQTWGGGRIHPHPGTPLFEG